MREPWVGGGVTAGGGGVGEDGRVGGWVGGGGEVKPTKQRETQNRQPHAASS